MTYETTQYLVHYGTKGMKWGVRRYQNADGTLTPEGREHYKANRKHHVLGTVKDTVKLSSQTSLRNAEYFLTGKSLDYLLRTPVKKAASDYKVAVVDYAKLIANGDLLRHPVKSLDEYQKKHPFAYLTITSDPQWNKHY